MYRGERFITDGYDIQARIKVAHGGGNALHDEVLVLGNNSSHFLIAWNLGSPAHGDGTSWGSFIISFSYADVPDEAGVVVTYAAALGFAVQTALAN